MRLIVLVAVFASILLAASTSPGRLASNRLAANKLASNKLAGNRLSSNRLAANKLAANQLAVTDLLSTPDGREVLSYLVSCALPPDVTMQGEFEGQTYEFPGGMGLAPKWIKRRLSGKDKRWVSACILARINAHDTAEAVSLRGPNDAFGAPSPDEALLYTLEEGTFYGNIFTPDDQPMIMIACRGRDQAAGESGGLVLRDCAEPDPTDPTHTRCGFTWAGDCDDFTPADPSAYACEDRSPVIGYYEKCHDQPGLGVWRRSKKYKEAITVFTAQ